MALHKAGPITPEEFDHQVLAHGETTLVCFLEEWSEPCKEMEETVGQVAEALYGRVDVRRMSLEEAPLIAAKYGINSIPALVLFVGGEPVQKLFGIRTLEDTVKSIAKHLEEGVSGRA